MADYTARLVELERGVQDAQVEDSKVERAGGAPVVLARYVIVSQQLRDYMDWRERAMTDGLKILGNESDSDTGDRQQGYWGDHFRKAGQEAQRRVTELVKDDGPSHQNLKRLGETVASQESTYFNHLATTSLAWIQGQMQANRRKLQEESRSLLDKWRQHSDQDRSVDQKFSDARKEIFRIFNSVVAELVEDQRKGEEAVRAMVDKARNLPIPDKPLAVEIAAEAAGHFLKRANELRASAEELESRFSEFYRYEETIVVVFSELREAVRVFLQKTNLDIAIKEFNQAQRESFDAAAKCPSSGQQEDAKQFVERAATATKAWLDKFQTEYNQFVDTHKGVFVGPLGDRVIEELLEVREWQEGAAELTRMDVQTKLKRLYEDTARVWHMRLDGLTDAQKNALEPLLKMEIERLGQGVVRFVEGSFWDRLKEAFTGSRDKLVDRVKRSKGGLE